MTRGQYTEDLNEKFGIVSRDQLRLLPYFQYLLINHQPVDPAKINAIERKYLQQWRDEKRITFSSTEPPTCTHEFWNWMNDVLWATYIPHLKNE
jgi:hypothetical protein